MMNLVLIFLGGGLGAVCRHGVGMLALRNLGAGFPYGTLMVNVVGSLAMGMIIAWLVSRSSIGDTSHSLRLVLTTGFLGGFTTFSAFSLDTINLWERGEITLTLIYVLSSVFASIGAVFVGLWLMRTVSGS